LIVVELVVELPYVQEAEVHGKKRELEVLIEEEKVLGSNISTSQKEIETLVKALADIDYLLGETR